MTQPIGPLVNWILCILVSIFLLEHPARAYQNPVAADAEYASLVQKLQSGDFSIDFWRLRLSCVKSGKCDPRGEREDMTVLRKVAQSRQYDQVVRAAEKLISQGFTNIEAHAALAQAYTALKDSAKADFHRQIVAALLNSIRGTGDGKSKETAFKVVGTHEEYIALAAMGLPPLGNQALVAGKPHSYDVMTRDDPATGQKVTIYFNIDAFYPMEGL